MTVLFVDDEIQVLRGIERMLDAAEVEWDVAFANSGEEALKTLAEDGEIDTVVTDMRMPGMDGARLLQEISEHYPHVVRIVLSGQADKEAVFRAVNPMHQYLAKPCDAETLKTTICRAGALRDVLISDDLHRVLGGISKLPSVPATYQKLLAELENEGSSVEAIGDIISADAAMTVKILQIANSAVFGLRNPVASAARAATFLGTETIKSLVLTVGVFQEFDDLVTSDFSINSLMNHSLEVAAFAKKIAEAESLPKVEVDAAFTAGIVHDIGKLVLLAADSEGFAESIGKATRDNLPSWQAEREVFGVDHAAVGARMLSIWGIPQDIVEIVALHHNPADSGERRFTTLTAVTAANEIGRSGFQAATAGPDTVFAEYLATIGCEEKLAGWTELYSGLQEDEKAVS